MTSLDWTNIIEEVCGHIKSQSCMRVELHEFDALKSPNEILFCVQAIQILWQGELNAVTGANYGN